MKRRARIKTVRLGGHKPFARLIEREEHPCDVLQCLGDGIVELDEQHHLKPRRGSWLMATSYHRSIFWDIPSTARYLAIDLAAICRPHIPATLPNPSKPLRRFCFVSDLLVPELSRQEWDNDVRQPPACNMSRSSFVADSTPPSSLAGFEAAGLTADRGRARQFHKQLDRVALQWSHVQPGPHKNQGVHVPAVNS